MIYTYLHHFVKMLVRRHRDCPAIFLLFSHRALSSISVQEKLSSCTRVTLKEVSQHFSALELFISRAKSQAPNAAPQLDTQQVTAIQNGTFVPLMGRNWVTFGVLVNKQLPKDTVSLKLHLL